MALLTLSGGRVLEYARHGPDGAPLVLFHHGTPGAALPYAPLVDAAADVGLATLLYARPGYGRSTPSPGRSVADCAADVAELLDHLGADAVVTAGWSGGGPHALAVAALLADRCASVAVIAGVAPFDAHGIDWTAGMGADNVAEFAAAGAGGEALEAWLAPAADHLVATDVAGILEGMASLLPEPDLETARTGLGSYLVDTFAAALGNGLAGWRDDDLAFVRPWGFDPAGIEVPTALWFGAADRMVPESHGRWLADRIRRPEVHAFARDGHLSIIGHAEAIFASMVAAL